MIRYSISTVLYSLGTALAGTALLLKINNSKFSANLKNVLIITVICAMSMIAGWLYVGN